MQTRFPLTLVLFALLTVPLFADAQLGLRSTVTAGPTANSGSICYSDGCVYFQHDNGHWLRDAQRYVSANQLLNSIRIGAMHPGVQGPLLSSSDEFGRLTQVTCFNGVVAFATYVGSSGPSCSVTFDANPVTRPNGTTVRWSSSNAARMEIANIGPVGLSGAVSVAPPATTDYSGVVFDASGRTANCPAVLAVQEPTPPPPSPCPQGQIRGAGGACVAAACVSTGYRCGVSGNLSDNCGSVSVCPAGCSPSTNRCNCQASPQCSADRTSVVNACDGTIIERCTDRGAGWYCSAGACIPSSIGFDAFDASNRLGAFRATGHLQARPALVRPGEATQLYWKVSNAQSCRVTSTNNDSLVGLLSGVSGQASRAISQSTRFTFVCTALPGASPASVQESVDVDVAPEYREL